MKKHIFLAVYAALCFAFVACNQNTPDDTKRGGDTPTSQHQPSDPSTWSPEGKIYIHVRDYEPDTTRTITFSKDRLSIRFSCDHGKSRWTYGGNYVINYPSVEFTYNEENTILLFLDTLRLVWDGIGTFREDEIFY